MDQAIRIGVVGDFNPALPMHIAIGESFAHAAEKLGLHVQTEWVPTPSFKKENIEKTAGRYRGLWVAPASPYLSMEGALAAIQFARTHGRPFYAT